jgi:SAM-dependent methyltransferase
MNTIGYYNKNAQAFFDSTINVGMEHLYGPFLALLPASAHILDAGCGSGRDSLYFKQRGYTVTAMEPSEELARLSEKLLGQEVLRQKFQDINAVELFDGIWACASLLHVPRVEMDDVLRRLTKALRHDGAFYASFKYGNSEGERNGRFFNSYDEGRLQELLSHHAQLQLVSSHQTEDVRATHKGEKWLNAYIVRGSN